MCVGNHLSVEAVVFDLYGTILIQKDNRRPWDDYYDYYRQFVSDHGIDLSRTTFEDTVRAYKRNREEDCDAPEPGGLSIFERQLSGECRHLGISVTEHEIRELATALCCTWQDALYEDPDFRHTAATLKGSVPIALLTNFDHPPHVHSTLGASGLNEFFSHIVVSGDTGMKKPDPGIFHLMMDVLQIDPSRALYVGDSYVDYRGSSDAGMIPVIIRRNGWEDSAFHADEEQLLADAHAKGLLHLIQSHSELISLV